MRRGEEAGHWGRTEKSAQTAPSHLCLGNSRGRRSAVWHCSATLSTVREAIFFLSLSFPSCALFLSLSLSIGHSCQNPFVPYLEGRGHSRACWYVPGRGCVYACRSVAVTLRCNRQGSFSRWHGGGVKARLGSDWAGPGSLPAFRCHDRTEAV